MLQGLAQTETASGFNISPQWMQLVATRDILFSTLLEELSLNKILLQNMENAKPASKSTKAFSNPVDEDELFVVPSENEA